MVELSALQSTSFDLEFVHINCQSLAASVRDEALGWVQALSQCMRELDTQTLQVSSCGLVDFMCSAQLTSDLPQSLLA